MRNIDKITWFLLGGVFFTRLAMFMSTPFLAVYLTNQLSFSPLDVGIILGINPLVNIGFCFFSGSLIDKFETKKILSTIAILWGGVFILFYFSVYFWQFLMLNILNGICYSVFEPALKTEFSKIIDVNVKLLVFNIRYFAVNLGAFFGPFLIFVFGFKNTIFPYTILGAVYIIYGLLILIFLKSDKKIVNNNIRHISTNINITSALNIIFRNKAFLYLITAMSFSYFGYSQLTSTISQFMTNANFESGYETYSLLLSVNAGTILLFQFPILMLTKKMNPFYVLTFSNILLATGVFIFGVSNKTPVLFISVFIFSLGELLFGSRFDPLVDEITPEENKGIFFASAEFIKSGKVIGPIVGGGLLEYFDYTSGFPLFSTLALLTIIGALIFILAKKVSSREEIKSYE